MKKGILMDKMLKLIIEDNYVTRVEHLSTQLNIDHDTILRLLQEMEKSGHLQLIRSGSQQVPVIIVKSPGREFYKSSSYSTLYNEIAEDKNKLSRRTIAWILIGVFLVILLIIGFTQGWFS